MAEKDTSRFTIAEEIGRGGEAIVYKGVQTSLGRLVAIKTMPAQPDLDPDYISRVRREAGILAELQHQNIVYVYDIDRLGDTDYLIMEYVAGKTIAQLLEAQGRFTVSEAARIVSDVASALAHAHERHVIHRDIKPGNIMITQDGVVKVTDFGVAKATVNAMATRTGLIQGTLYYMSPEQARGEKDVDGRSDIYSLGIVFYQMVTGRVPFSGKSAYAILDKQIKEQPVLPSDLIDDLPPAYEEIILKCMEKDRENRYPTARDLIEALRKVKSERDRGPDEERKRPRPKTTGFSQKRMLLLGALATALLIMVFFILGEKLKGPPPSPTLRSVEARNQELLATLGSRPGAILESEVKRLLTLKTGFRNPGNGREDLALAIGDFLNHAEGVTKVEQGPCDLLFVLETRPQETKLVMHSNIFGDDLNGSFEESFAVKGAEQLLSILEAIVNREYVFHVLSALHLLNYDKKWDIAIEIRGDADRMLRIGDRINICMTSSRKTYSMLFNVNRDGIYLLFPRYGRADNLLNAGETICTGEIEVSPPTGNELVFAIGATDSDMLSPYHYQVSHDQPFYRWSYDVSGPDNAARLGERLLAGMQNAPTEKWSTASLFVRTYE